MKYKCLILDHDDTVVKSTPDIHYPSFIEALRVLRPDLKPLTLEEFIRYCFEPGFSRLCSDILKFTPEEQTVQYNLWKRHTKVKSPEFYECFPELIDEFKNSGGIVCVASHSESEQILRDYRLHCNWAPDLVFGWEDEEAHRKPRAYPVVETMKRFGLKREEILVLDDSKPGLVMARGASVAFAAAGWSHSIPEITDYMRDNSDFYFSSVDEFWNFLRKD